jgi:hypothetical protein
VKKLISVFLDSLIGGDRSTHVGEGSERAEIRLRHHRDKQAARVAPALPAFAERRANLAKRRVKRWQTTHGRDLSEAPGHIKRMSREATL